MFVRLSAWLNAVPEIKNDKGASSDGKRRIETLEELGVYPDIPECRAAHVAAYLYEIGPSNGESAVTHSEMGAWQRNTGIQLTPWETRMIRRLSIEHMSMTYEARDLSCPCPWAYAPYAQIGEYIKSMRVKASVRKAAEL